MKQDMLSEYSSSEDEDLHRFTINEHYAKAYEYRKEREELAKLKEKYGSDASYGEEDESDSESDESEDEDGEELTPAVDAAILRTLARIKRKDPEIYDTSKDVFTEERQKSGKLSVTAAPEKKTKEGKPITLHEHRIAAVLEGSRSASPEPADGPTHVEEQEWLRKETIAAFHASEEGDAEEGEGGLFTLREKTQVEIEREEKEYRRYLEREVEGLEGLIEVEEDVGGLRMKEDDAEAEAGERKKKKKSKKSKGKEKEALNESDQQFLMNYILNRGWIDRSAKRLPTFDEITAGAGTSRSKKAKSEESVKDEEGEDDGADDGLPAIEGEDELDEDEFDEVAERFESSYNFRFEEPNAPHIPFFPRQIETVRRPAEHAERRKEARERRKERKEEEKRLKKEEVRMLKGLKMRELNQKLARVSKEGGWANSQALENLDLDGDWDPKAYDKQMAAVLNEVEGPSGSGVVDEEKPTWDDDIDIGDIVPPSDDEGEKQESSSKSKKKDRKKKKKKKVEGAEEDGVDIDMMDADAEQARDEEEWDGTEEMRKKVLDKYMDDIYGLDFNDMAAGMPTRFRYIPVPESSYGLSAVDILMANDKDLNEYMGLKKYAPYRKEKDRWDAKRPQKLQELKQKLAAKGVDTHADVQGEGERKEKKRKGKKERLKAKAAQTVTEENEEADEEAEAKSGKRPREEQEEPDHKEKETQGNGHTEGPVKKKRRRHKKSGHGDTAAEAEA